MARAAVRLLTLAILVYLALTGYFGFAVGRDIAQTKSSPFVAIGASLVGRDAAEKIAMRDTSTPTWATYSPTFWIALRLTE